MNTATHHDRRTRQPGTMGTSAWPRAGRYAAAMAATQCALLAAIWQAQPRHAGAQAGPIVEVRAAPVGPPAAGPGEIKPSLQQDRASRPNGREEWHNYNGGVIPSQEPLNPTKWTIDEPVLLTYFRTCHGNGGRGKPPGTLGLKHEDGTIYGPWRTLPADGRGRELGMSWFVEPRVIVKPGTYTIVDSDPPSWANNDESNRCGYAVVQFYRLIGRVRTPNRLADGLVSLWTLDGHTRDLVGRNHATVKGNVMFTFAMAAAGARLDNPNAYVAVGPNPDLGSGDWTVSAWYRKVNENRDTMAIVGKGPWALLVGEGKVQLHVAGLASELSLSAPDKQVDASHHLAGTLDRKAKRLRLYLDGELKAETPVGDLGSLATDLPLAFGMRDRGKQAPPDRHLEGFVDDVSIWNRALSAEEIHLVYRSEGLRDMVAGIMSLTPALTRQADADLVLNCDGTKLLGTLEDESFTIATARGEVKIATSDLAGFAAADADSGTVWMLLEDGQAILGRPARASVAFRLPNGLEMKVPVKNIRQCSLRVREPKADAPAGKDAPSPRPMLAMLANGERLGCSAEAGELAIKADYGRVTVPFKALLRIEPPDLDPARPVRSVMLANGSIITGMIQSDEQGPKLRAGRETKIPLEAIDRLFSDGRSCDQSKHGTVLMRNGDRLVGEITDKTLTVETADGKMTFEPRCTWNIRPDDADKGVVKVRLWTGSDVTGRLAEKELSFSGGPDGTEMKLPVEKIASITTAGAMPPAGVAEQVLKLIVQLGAESYKDRQAATDSLIQMGPAIIPLLEKRSSDPDPEVRMRVQLILEKIRARMTEGPDSPRSVL